MIHGAFKRQHGKKFESNCQKSSSKTASQIQTENMPTKFDPIRKHNEFEALAEAMIGATRTIETTPRGIVQHVVQNGVAILRWPVTYAPKQK